MCSMKGFLLDKNNCHGRVFSSWANTIDTKGVIMFTLVFDFYPLEHGSALWLHVSINCEAETSVTRGTKNICLADLFCLMLV